MYFILSSVFYVIVAVCQLLILKIFWFWFCYSSYLFSSLFSTRYPYILNVLLFALSHFMCFWFPLSILLPIYVTYNMCCYRLSTYYCEIVCVHSACCKYREGFCDTSQWQVLCQFCYQLILYISYQIVKFQLCWVNSYCHSTVVVLDCRPSCWQRGSCLCNEPYYNIIKV